MVSRQRRQSSGHRTNCLLSATAAVDAASALAQFNDRILELMADVVLNPSFPESEVELAKQNTKESLRQQRAQPSFLASEMVSRVMFGEHPYSVVAPTPAPAVPSAKSCAATRAASRPRFQ